MGRIGADRVAAPGRRRPRRRCTGRCIELIERGHVLPIEVPVGIRDRVNAVRRRGERRRDRGTSRRIERREPGPCAGTDVGEVAAGEQVRAVEHESLHRAVGDRIPCRVCSPGREVQPGDAIARESTDVEKVASDDEPRAGRSHRLDRAVGARVERHVEATAQVDGGDTITPGPVHRREIPADVRDLDAIRVGRAGR